MKLVQKDGHFYALVMDGESSHGTGWSVANMHACSSIDEARLEGAKRLAEVAATARAWAAATRAVLDVVLEAAYHCNCGAEADAAKKVFWQLEAEVDTLQATLPDLVKALGSDPLTDLAEFGKHVPFLPGPKGERKVA